MTTLSNGALAALVNDMVIRWDAREAQHRDWLGGTADGGPYGDGRYPVSTSGGLIFYIKCPAALAEQIEGPASTVAQQASDASDSATSAGTSATSALNALALATAMRDAALVHREGAEIARQGAEGAEANALVFRDAAAASAIEAAEAVITYGGGSGGGGGGSPYFIPDGTVFVLGANVQTFFMLPIEIEGDGLLIVDGHLLEIDP
jgi:hypothetical protein